MLLTTPSSIRKGVRPFVSALGLTFAALAAAATTASASLIGYYPFDGNTNDTSGRGNNPTAGTVGGYVTGYQGQAASFNATNSNHLELPINVSPSLMPNLTMGAWVSTTTAALGGILSADDSSPGDYDRHLGIDNRNLQGASTGSLGYAAFGGGNDNSHVLNSGIAPTAAFTFLAVRYTPTTVTLFVGNQMYTLNATPTDLNQFPQLWVGKNPSYDSYFTGAVDNVFVFDQALTDTQVNSIRTNGVLSVVPEPGTYAVCGSFLAAFALVRRRTRKARAC